MLDLQVPSFLLSGTLVGLIAQRLMRKICPYCAEEYSVSLKDLNQKGFNFEGPEKILLKRGKGCHQCRDTGYFKRESVYEVVGIDDDMAKLISDQPEMLALKEMAKKKKFRTLWENAIRKMLNGVTTFEEVLRVTQPDPHFNEPIHLRKMNGLAMAVSVSYEIKTRQWLTHGSLFVVTFLTTTVAGALYTNDNTTLS